MATQDGVKHRVHARRKRRRVYGIAPNHFNILVARHTRSSDPSSENLVGPSHWLRHTLVSRLGGIVRDSGKRRGPFHRVQPFRHGGRKDESGMALHRHSEKQTIGARTGKASPGSARIGQAYGPVCAIENSMFSSARLGRQPFGGKLRHHTALQCASNSNCGWLHFVMKKATILLTFPTSQ